MLNDLTPTQKKSITKLNTLLKSRDIISITKENNWYHLKFKDGQQYSIVGEVVNNSMIFEKTEVKENKRRLF
jgi:hypothetical protein